MQECEELRERHFGCHELRSHDAYATVWAEDARSTDSRPPGKLFTPLPKSECDFAHFLPRFTRSILAFTGGESVDEVAQRLTRLFERLEQKHEGDSILLVAHGDTLSILWALVSGHDLRQHREAGLPTGGLRKL